MSIKQKYKSILPDGRYQFIPFLTPIYHQVYDDPTHIEYEQGGSWHGAQLSSLFLLWTGVGRGEGDGDLDSSECGSANEVVLVSGGRR